MVPYFLDANAIGWARSFCERSIVCCLSDISAFANSLVQGPAQKGAKCIGLLSFYNSSIRCLTVVMCPKCPLHIDLKSDYNASNSFWY